MEAVFSQVGDVQVVSFVGRLNVEKAKSLAINSQTFHMGKVIFKLDKLSFVGSSGIQIFFQTLAEIQVQNKMARVTGVRTEFLQLLKFTNISQLAIDPTIEQAYGRINGTFTDPVVEDVIQSSSVAGIGSEDEATQKTDAQLKEESDSDNFMADLSSEQGDLDVIGSKAQG